MARLIFHLILNVVPPASQINRELPSGELSRWFKERDRMHTGRQHIEFQLSRARAVYREIMASGAAAQ
jgi:hypothetical protein